MEINTTELTEDGVRDFSDLIREVYDEFVAPDYSDEGNRHFYSFITVEALLERMKGGALTVCTRAGSEIIGACAFRDKTHMSLFFVKAKYHGRGIGRMMFAYGLRKIRLDYPEAEMITVNSSPFAVGIYKRLGFEAAGGRQISNGIISYPMVYRIK